MNVTNAFKSLSLKDALVRRLSFSPNEKLTLGLVIVSDDRQEVKSCELQFNRILHAAIDIKAVNFFGEIQDYFISKNSDYLLNILENVTPVFKRMGEFYLFSISTNTGKINIVAEEFTFSVIRKDQITGRCD